MSSVAILVRPCLQQKWGLKGWLFGCSACCVNMSTRASDVRIHTEKDTAPCVLPSAAPRWEQRRQSWKLTGQLFRHLQWYKHKAPCLKQSGQWLLTPKVVLLPLHECHGMWGPAFPHMVCTYIVRTHKHIKKKYVFVMLATHDIVAAIRGSNNNHRKKKLLTLRV